jgi:hypothetical protein
MSVEPTTWTVAAAGRGLREVTEVSGLPGVVHPVAVGIERLGNETNPLLILLTDVPAGGHGEGGERDPETSSHPGKE